MGLESDDRSEDEEADGKKPAEYESQLRKRPTWKSFAITTAYPAMISPGSCSKTMMLKTISTALMRIFLRNRQFRNAAMRSMEFPLPSIVWIDMKIL